MEHECGLEIAQRRKDRWGRARVGLKIDVFSALVEERIQLDLAIGRIHGHDVAIGLRNGGECWNDAQQQRKSRDYSLDYFHPHSGPLRGRWIKIYISSAT